MPRITLKHGPRLVMAERRRDKSTKKVHHTEVDITSAAHTYLFEQVTIDEGVTLEDVFKLVELNPVLRAIQQRNFIEEMLAETVKGVAPDYSAAYDPEGIEYLELYAVWRYNREAQEFEPVNQLSLSGIGYALKAGDVPEWVGEVPPGYRISWGISCANLRNLLPLPIKIKRDIPVYEENIGSGNHGKLLYTTKLASVTLGQVIEGLFWELSFHGGPAQTQAMMVGLNKKLEELNSGEFDSCRLPPAAF